MRPAALAVALVAGLSLPAAGQSSRTDAIEALPDPAALAPAEVPYVHPLFRAVDTSAVLTVARPPLTDLESLSFLAVSVHVDATGRVLEAVAVEPPLRALAAPIPTLSPRWRFAPATKDGSPVATWATLGLEILVDLEKGAWGDLTLRPLKRDDVLTVPLPESPGDGWLARYPKEIDPKQPGAISVEDTDAPPNPTKTAWDFDGSRQRSRVSALVEVTPAGTVSRLVPIGSENEPLVLAWVRKSLPGWKLSPAMAGGKAVASWLALEGAVDYTINSAKLRNRRSVKKNLRGMPGA